MATAYVEVPLGGKKAAGRVALIDIDDYPLVIDHPWHVHEGTNAGSVYGPYAAFKRTVKVYMHSLITGLPKVDHQNGDGLDNRRENLRPATQSENAANSRKAAGCTSRYKGVSWSSSKKRWRANIATGGRQIFLGYFSDEGVAARAYDAAARETFGRFARLNFQEEAERGS